jgi:hypothetical protein
MKNRSFLPLVVRINSTNAFNAAAPFEKEAGGRKGIHPPCRRQDKFD